MNFFIEMQGTQNKIFKLQTFDILQIYVRKFDAFYFTYIFIRKIRNQFVVFETDKLIKKIHLNVCIPIIFNLDY